MLTIVFNTQYGAETLVTSAPFTVMNSPTVHLLLWGPNWGTGAGQTNPTTAINKAKAILNSTYFPGLTEYGSNGLIGSIDSYIDTTNPVPSGFNPGNLTGTNLTQAQTELTTVVNAGNLAGPGNPASVQVAPIYMIITDPGSSSGTNGGYNNTGTVATKSVKVDSMGTDSNLFGFGDTFSHEMTETITDPVSTGVLLQEPSTFPVTLLNNPLLAYNNSANQIQAADGEAEPNNQSHYTYGLSNGAIVQPFWSNANSAFIVPDGNSQKFALQPIWNTNTVTFTNTYNLTVTGDQKANLNDTIIISADVAGGTQVTLNGETANFDPSTSSFGGTPLKSITINSGNGNDTLIVDFSNGNPIPANGLLFSGGIGTNQITVMGRSGYTLANGSVKTNLGEIIGLVSVTAASLVGTSGNDTFDVSSWTGSGSINGQGGTDQVIATKDTNFTVSAGALSASDGMSLSLTSIEQATLTGGSNNNLFTVDSGGTISVGIAGGGGADTVSLQGGSFTTFNFQNNSCDLGSGFQHTSISYSGLQRVEAHAGSGVGLASFNILDLTSGPSIYCYGGTIASESSTMTISSNVIDSVGVQTFYYGGSGSDTLVVSPSESDAQTFFDVASSQVIHNHAGDQREFNFDAAVELVSLEGGDGADGFSVDNLAASNAVSIDGNGGDDVASIGFTDFDGSEPFSDSVKGNVTFHGNAGNDSLIVDDTAASAARTYELMNSTIKATGVSGLVSYDTTESVSLLGSQLADLYNFDGNVAANLNVYGQGGNDTFAWNAANNVFIDDVGNTTRYSVTLTGGAGTNALNFNDANRGEFNYNMYPTELVGYDINGAGVNDEDVGYSQMEVMTVTASADDNSIVVYGTSAEITGQTTLFLGGDSDTITVDMRDAAGNPTILSNLGISGGSGADTLYLVDPASTGTTWTISNPFGSSTQDATVTGDAFVGAGTDVENFNVDGSSGDDIFNVDQYKSGTALGISGGDGNDTLNLGNGNLPTNITNISAFSFNGQDGYDTFNVNNASETKGWGYTNTATTIQAVRSSPTAYNLTLGQSNTEQVNYNAGSNNDSLTLSAVAPGELLQFFGNDGNDSLLTTTPQTVQGPVYFYGGNGTANAYNNGSNADTVGRVVHLDQSSLGAFPGDDYFGPGGVLYFYSLQSMQFTMGSGSDTVYAEPNATATVDVRGGNPTTAPGDTLNLALAGVQNYVIAPNNILPGTGTVTSSNRQTFSYGFFETGPIVDDAAPQIILQSYDETPGSDYSVVFSEDVSSALSVNDLTLVNTTSGETISTGAMAMTYDAGTNTVSFTFPGYPGGFLPAGDYMATISSTLPDAFGNQLGIETPFEFQTVGPLPGDYNYDRLVNNDDYITWRSNFGDPVDVPGVGADGNANGVVDGADYVLWRAHSGDNNQAAGAAASMANYNTAPEATAQAATSRLNHPSALSLQSSLAEQLGAIVVSNGQVTNGTSASSSEQIEFAEVRRAALHQGSSTSVGLFSSKVERFVSKGDLPTDELWLLAPQAGPHSFALRENTLAAWLAWPPLVGKPRHVDMEVADLGDNHAADKSTDARFDAIDAVLEALATTPNIGFHQLDIV